MARIIAILDLEPRELPARGIGRVETFRDNALDVELDGLVEERFALARIYRAEGPNGDGSMMNLLEYRERY